MLMDIPIALVDDDQLYCETLAGDLGWRGFVVRSFSDEASVLSALQQGLETRVLVLDWTLRTMSGVEVLRMVRNAGFGMPVVFLTGRSLIEREAEALASGAVDFVDKARGVDVLAHRLRRAVGVDQHQMATFCRGELRLHPPSARAQWRGHDIELTFAEYTLVAFLVSRDGRPATYRDVYDRLRFPGFLAGQGELGVRINVRSMVKRIRRKFQAIDPAFCEIINLPNVGYSWGVGTMVE
jgi:two-component system response regulator ChvI